MVENETGESLLALDELLQFTGLNRNLLHAWERRYGLAPDARNKAGRRFYSMEQAERMRRIKRAVDAGHRVGRIAGLSSEALDALEPASSPESALKDFIDAARMLDSARVAGLLRVRLRSQGLRPWILQTVIPLLRHVGDLWGDARLAVASEHVISQGLKEVLLACLSGQTVEEDAPIAISTTLEGELHEFGALTAALVARIEGVNTLYLGPTLPVPEIAAAATRLKARFVLISSIMMPADAAIAGLTSLRQTLPADIVLIAGGRHMHGLPPAENLFVQPDLEGLPALLARR